ncbi:hypothetical protein J4234_01525 [Candidatus Woesearchaeota archaeon]|nr:hypothetical protein [Candidatus Woesearchaeota archaeon]
MRMLSDVFPNETEAKVAEGLLATLINSEPPITAVRLKREAQPDIKVLGVISGVGNDDYIRIFEKLIEEGYIGIRGVSTTETMTLGPNSLVAMSEDARRFFEEKYMD